MDIITQIKAAKSRRSLQSKQILETHLRGCVRSGIFFQKCFRRCEEKIKEIIKIIG
ncbi:MAG: metal-sensing transcriptional repressor [Bdellovibrionales bacterium]|nr:metal-sensing transcriptional repressor [Bdellovibrionales bacterium]